MMAFGGSVYAEDGTETTNATSTTDNTVNTNSETDELSTPDLVRKLTLRAQGGEFGEKYFDVEREAKKGVQQKVVVLFKSHQPAEQTLPKVKQAMRVIDSGAWFYPYWVTSFVDEQTVGQCGLVVGTWWTSSEADGLYKWSRNFYPQIQGDVQATSVVFLSSSIRGEAGESPFISHESLLGLCKTAPVAEKPKSTKTKPATKKSKSTKSSKSSK